jgi:hypothetical protein
MPKVHGIEPAPAANYLVKVSHETGVKEVSDTPEMQVIPLQEGPLMGKR